ncbi:DUF3017 domain-containing protein [Actinomyces howellii]|uniref:DUF3017 domain-containing protein n=1 Tax=Actinomyces howellii TaxID=52771 RepID=UPI002F944B5E
MTQDPSTGQDHGVHPDDPLAGITPLPRGERNLAPYRTLGVVLVAGALAAVPALTLLGHGRWAVTWLGLVVGVLALLRLQRPEGTWIAARGRRFDVVAGLVMAATLVLLAPYADLPRVL